MSENVTKVPSIWTDPVGYLRENAERNAATAGRDEAGDRNDPGWLNNLTGALTGATTEGTDAWEEKIRARQWKPQYEALGGTYVPGRSKAENQVAIDDLKRQRSNRLHQESPEGIQQAEDRKLAQQQASRADLALAESINARVDSNEWMKKQFLMERADRAQERLDMLEMRRQDLRREDMRYNEQIERENRKDRKLAMQNLAAGLASLGAAFAM